MSGAWRVGTSGWVYPHWRGVFYPPDMPQKQWFSYYARHFDTVEINNTFYRLPSESAVAGWRAQAPPNFLYAVKANRYLTHVRRLRDCAGPLQRFIERIQGLEPHLGPLLYQLPPNWAPNLPRLESFLKLLPSRFTHVMEFRDARWFQPAVYELLRDYGVGLCLYHMPGQQTPFEVTSRVVYIRFHGVDTLYAGSYPDALLKAWAERIRHWVATGHYVYAYFNNDALGHAVHDARRLIAFLEQV